MSDRVKRIAERCIERMSALDIKGKRADDAALHYFVGAAVLADEIGDKALCEHLTRVAAMVIAVRGMFGVREIAAGR